MSCQNSGGALRDQLHPMNTIPTEHRVQSAQEARPQQTAKKATRWTAKGTIIATRNGSTMSSFTSGSGQLQPASCAEKNQWNSMSGSASWSEATSAGIEGMSSNCRGSI